MNYSSLALAALGGTVASFAVGFLLFWLLPGLIEEGHKYPAVFRPKEEMMKVMPTWTRRNFHFDPGCRHNFRNDTSGRIGHCGSCALRRSHWHFRGLRICAAQLREPEHRAKTRSGTGCGLLRPVDYHRHSHRSYLQTPRYTIVVNSSVVVLRLKL